MGQMCRPSPARRQTGGQQMTPEQIRVAVAEVAGLLPRESKRGLVDQIGVEIPDYPNDLNAIHEAIRSQPNDVQWTVFTELAAIVEAEIPAAFGTALQYCEALL